MSNPTVRPLSEELRNVAKEELFETDDNIIADLKLIKEWILQNPHLKVNMNDQNLLAFIRCCKHSLEKTKQKIDMHYTVRTHSPDIYDGDMITEKTLALIKLGVFLPLPKTESPAGPRIILTRIGLIDLNLYKVQEFIKVVFMISYILIMEDDNYAVSGCVSINDFSDVKIEQLIPWYFAIPLRRHIKNGVDGSSVRNKRAHLINLPTGYHTVMNLVKTFLNDKLRSRFSDHSSMDTFYSIFPKSLMPSEYGGENGSLASIAEVWKEKVLSYRNVFEEVNNYGVDETKRPGKPKNPESLFGCDGSFKKLDFD